MLRIIRYSKILLIHCIPEVPFEINRFLLDVSTDTLCRLLKILYDVFKKNAALLQRSYFLTEEAKIYKIYAHGIRLNLTLVALR